MFMVWHPYNFIFIENITIWFLNKQNNDQQQQQMQKYDIVSVIGEGAYGVVLKCKDIEKTDYVAIKKFKESDDEQLTRKTTMREVKILKMLSHQNIVEMKEAFRKKGIVYLVFQYVQNNLLEVLEKSPNGLHPHLIRKLMFQLVKGLMYLHGLQIIHRDIKPQNLLVSSKNDLKICDFGFARQTRKEKNEAQMTDYVATRWYRPPQLLVGGQYNKEIDMWAVGCIMCELIDGNPLFPGQNELDQLFLIQKTFGPLPSQLHERFIKNPRFLGMKFPEIQNLDVLQKKYFGKIDQKGLSFVKSLLKMIPGERLTAEQAYNHPYFQIQRQNCSKMSQITAERSRKQVYTSVTNRNKDIQQNKSTKYGKIYNNSKNNSNALAMIYQSSNNWKTNNQKQSKSYGKPHKKITTDSYEASLEKYRNTNLLLKTEARGFFPDEFERSEYHLENSPKKKTQNGQIKKQLPFLITGTSQPGEQKTSILKKKPHVVINKKGSYRTNLITNFAKN